VEAAEGAVRGCAGGLGVGVGGRILIHVVAHFIPQRERADVVVAFPGGRLVRPGGIEGEALCEAGVARPVFGFCGVGIKVGRAVPVEGVELIVDDRAIHPNRDGGRNPCWSARRRVRGGVGPGAWWDSRRAIRPLRRIVETSGRMSAGNLEERIPLRSDDDREFADLIAAPNDMTERLQESFTRSARFTADASHELRTPIAVMQNTLNETLRSDFLDEGARESIAIVLHQASRLKRMTHSLLLLSQAGAGELPVRCERYDLSNDLEGLMKDAKSLCETTGLTFEKRIDPGLFVEADRGLMQQVFQNLVSNAVKHNRPEGFASVQLTRANGAKLVLIPTTPGTTGFAVTLGE
jgi:signal transduction histidine kinase